MLGLKHNVVNILYSIKGMVETYFARVEEGHLEEKEKTFTHAETLLEKIYAAPIKRSPSSSASASRRRHKEIPKSLFRSFRQGHMGRCDRDASEALLVREA